VALEEELAIERDETRRLATLPADAGRALKSTLRTAQATSSFDADLKHGIPPS
jgi:hypothetical protein